VRVVECEGYIVIVAILYAVEANCNELSIADHGSSSGTAASAPNDPVQNNLADIDAVHHGLVSREQCE